MMRKYLFGLLALLMLCSTLACNKDARQYRKWSLKGTVAQRDSAAFYYYEKEDYDKASFLFEELIGLYRGRPRAETALYHFAYTKYKQRFYLVAAYHFEQYTKLYPNNKKAEECAFMNAMCYYKESDPYYLDQSSTQKALDQFQFYLVSYPGSSREEQAIGYINELRERLAKKDLEQGILYYNLENYKAALTSFEVFMQTYPDSRYREEAMFRLFEASVALADISTKRRKKNRYLDALDHYKRLVDRYSTSQYLKDAESLYIRAKRNLGKILAEEEESSSR